MFLLTRAHAPGSTLFPYTTLFRSPHHHGAAGRRPAHRALCIRLVPERQRRRAERMAQDDLGGPDRKSTRLNSSHVSISYAVFCLKKKKAARTQTRHLLKCRMRKAE